MINSIMKPKTIKIIKELALKEWKDYLETTKTGGIDMKTDKDAQKKMHIHKWFFVIRRDSSECEWLKKGECLELRICVRCKKIEFWRVVLR